MLLIRTRAVPTWEICCSCCHSPPEDQQWVYHRLPGLWAPQACSALPCRFHGVALANSCPLGVPAREITLSACLRGWSCWSAWWLDHSWSSVSAPATSWTRLRRLSLPSCWLSMTVVLRCVQFWLSEQSLSYWLIQQHNTLRASPLSSSHNISMLCTWRLSTLCDSNISRTNLPFCSVFRQHQHSPARLSSPPVFSGVILPCWLPGEARCSVPGYFLSAVQTFSVGSSSHAMPATAAAAMLRSLLGNNLATTREARIGRNHRKGRDWTIIFRSTASLVSDEVGLLYNISELS